MIYSVIYEQKNMLLFIALIIIMEQAFLTTSSQKINGKTYFVPKYNLQGFEKYLLPSLEFKGMQHVYFHPNDINQLYQEQNIDPNNLQCNLKYDPTQDINKPVRKMTEEKKFSEKLQTKPSQYKQPEKIQTISQMIKNRPPLREKGPTHFIHIPLVDACKQAYENLIRPVIDDNDLDSLVPLQTLHATILTFRLRNQEDLPKWQKILQSIKLKKVRIMLKGVGIFPVKLNTNITRVFFIKVDGLDDLIHDVVQKAISEGLIKENELKEQSFITFDKKRDMYRAQQHLTIIKTKGDDLIDAGTYLKALAKLNIPKVTFSDMRLSVIGSFDGKGYFDQMVIPVDK